MASMVAKPGCSSGSNVHSSSSLTVQEKGSRNKRKFRAELGYLNKTSPSTQNECSSYEFSAEKFEVMSSNGHPTGCDLCSVRQDHFDGLKLDLGLPSGENPTDVNPRWSREDFEIDEFQDADWNDFTEAELEELVLINLNAIFRSAIKKIVACGYTEEAATKAVSRSGICYGCKDTVSNIVDNGLTFLKSGQEIDYSREHFFEDLQLLEKYILAELICVLREVRPFFSNGDAMWCLLICDMNVFHACAMDGDPFGSWVSDGTTNVNLPTQVKSETKSFDNSSKTNLSITCSHSHQSEAARFSNNSKSKNSIVHNGEDLNENGTNSTCDGVDNKPFSIVGTSSSVSEGKIGNSKKFQSNTANREYILRQKSLHLEKNYRTYGPKGSSRAGKLSGMGGLIFDKKVKAVSGSTAINLKSGLLKTSKGMGINVVRDNGNDNLSTAALSSSNLVSNSEAVDTNSGFFKNELQPASPVSSAQPVLPAAETSPLLPTTDTELSLSFPTKGNTVSSPNRFDETSNINHAGKPFAKSLGRWVPHDTKDEMIVKLIPRVRELQVQLQEWTEWANQKVMQAARRLGKDKAELKTLREEKDEVERLKKEKQTLEENTMKKLSEMENALCNASGQVELANSAVRRLEIENASLRQEMEDAKLRAAESAASCQEVSKREKTTLMKFHSWEKQKTVFQAELIAEKRILTQLLIELEQAKNVQEQYEAKWKLEEQARQELFMQATSLTKEREQIEASVKAKQDTIRLKAENNLQRYKDNIQKLEKQISELRRKSDSSRIAALKRGIDGSYASILSDSKTTPNQKDTWDLALSSSMKNLQLHSVKREHECVMCLTEERFVVFLPCAHQVVCTTCNELHEKQGMKDCPSCRSPIRQRISIRTAPA